MAEDPLDLLAALVRRYELDDPGRQDEALEAARRLGRAVWGGYAEGLEALARRVESRRDGDPVARAMRVLALREEAADPGHLVRAARRRQAAMAGRVEGPVPSPAPPPTLTEEDAAVEAGRPLADLGEDPRDPCARLAGWSEPWQPPPAALREVVERVRPLPDSVVAARDETLTWRRRRASPRAVLPTACAARAWVVEDLWARRLPAKDWSDLLARLEYWAERDGGEESIFNVLRGDVETLSRKGAAPAEGTAARVRELREAHPDWSLARIGQAVGISRQAVHKHLKKGNTGRPLK